MERNSNWLLVVVIIVLAVALLYFVNQGRVSENVGVKEVKEAGTTTADEPSAAKGDWQAVFLTNGQVYFGHLSEENSQYVKLTEIYYLQIQKTLQPDPQANTTPAEQPRLSLVKLGNELHGPTDEMRINREQILFYEDLKPDSRVVQAIIKHKEDQAAGEETGTE